jgi:hypothetical protein
MPRGQKKKKQKKTSLRPSKGRNRVRLRMHCFKILGAYGVRDDLEARMKREGKKKKKKKGKRERKIKRSKQRTTSPSQRQNVALRKVSYDGPSFSFFFWSRVKF